MPLSIDVLPLYVVETEQDEPVTVRVEEIPIAETIPSGWQMQVLLPASSLDEQHTFAPLPPLLLLLHAATRPTNTINHADVIRFIEETPFWQVSEHLIGGRGSARSAKTRETSPSGVGTLSASISAFRTIHAFAASNLLSV